MSHPKVSLIIVNWNGKDDTIECTESLKLLDYPNYEIIIVDNGSTDGSPKELRRRFPDITLVETGENLGYGGGANEGIKVAISRGSDYVFPLNNDLTVDRESLTELIKVAEGDRKIGMVCPKIRWYDRPDWICSVAARIDFRCIIQLPRHIGNIPDKGQYDKQMDIDASGTFLVKKEVAEKVGMFSPDYFLYLEDFDWCIRTRRAGYKIVYVPTSVMYHKGSASTGRPLSPRSVYYNTRNRFLLWRRHLNKKRFLSFFILFFTVTVPLRIVYYLLAVRKIEYLKSFLMGVRDGLKIALAKT